MDTFDDTPLYRDPADHPTEAEIAARRDAIWHPYHAKLTEELARLKAQHGVAALWDAHSIRSVLPRFFEGRLPDLNLGTADGASCDPALAAQLLAIGRESTGYTAVLNGRFKGGHITRQHGKPAQGVHAVQLEMTQASYMMERQPFDYLPDVAAGSRKPTPLARAASLRGTARVDITPSILAGVSTSGSVSRLIRPHMPIAVPSSARSMQYRPKPWFSYIASGPLRR